jgi:ABC-type polysaccharide/polyol phosphate export permease
MSVWTLVISVGGLLGGTAPPWAYVAYATAISAGLLVWGAFSFKKMERRFADVI